MIVHVALRIAMRAAIIVGLIVSGWTPAAMAMPRVSDCAMMMQSGSTADNSSAPDMRAPCPFAAYCAVASVFVAPAAVSTEFVVYETPQVHIGFDDLGRPEFQPSPPARPPRS
ncbi:hypothetical protein [Bosea vaviloviae]|uniref:DUF2946 domain-containing protein n=1 Tax=Bosea vaviloviae TaxID=1526658 RepID=A0A1D7U4C7_9HYPH|nr:hypothetical protein [Bosea vaviloviae]AOO82233.1 hypothetical protein BHK69_18885 [Bosea vaviloviae]